MTNNISINSGISTGRIQNGISMDNMAQALCICLRFLENNRSPDSVQKHLDCMLILFDKHLYSIYLKVAITVVEVGELDGVVTWTNCESWDIIGPELCIQNLWRLKEDNILLVHQVIGPELFTNL
ncbi:hypothetical protein Dsin_021042 [Dipteronia sinensis]|uniref:Uncharacterized protein n=1 Tax=Dipteronia sinensis TaxID=43782 RepID=A0AAE0E4J7_9ROSI|nr:hypothetical protein Dsin_021042 [Dipteronia sinensis]